MINIKSFSNFTENNLDKKILFWRSQMDKNNRAYISMERFFGCDLNYIDICY